MKAFRFSGKLLIPIFALGGSLCLGVHSFAGQSAQQRLGTSTDARIADSEQRLGPFAIAGQNYTVVLHEKRLPSASDPAFAETLAGLEITDPSGNVSYQKTFSYAIEQGRFQRSVLASAQLASGKTGAGIVIRYLVRPATSPAGAPQTTESWQLFGLVSGRLAPLAKPAPIGDGSAGGPFMGVMMRAANGTVSVISEPDTFDVRAWAGSFYVFIPLRVNWNHGGLGAGQRCVEMIGGGLKEVGCDMRAEVQRKPSAEEFGFVRVFPEANENPAAVEHVVVQRESRVEILGARAITNWSEKDDLIKPLFSDVWLHVRIDAHTGWIHGDEDLAALGLPAGSPAP